MGALGFSYPQKVKKFLQSIGIQGEITFQRSHYQLITPFFNILYSRPFDEFKEDLKRIYPTEKKIEVFFAKLENIIDDVKNISSWHPDYLMGERKTEDLKNADPDLKSKMHLIEQYSRMPCTTMLKNHFTNPTLINLIGSQGTNAPTMSVLNLALMWNIMSKKGIWFPSCGIHGLTDMMEETFQSYGGTLKIGLPVKKVLISGGKARGVLCQNGEVYTSDWVVCNTDYKKTFLELIEKNALPKQYLKSLEDTPYTQSEMCVYLGVDPKKMNLGAMKATHLFYRHKYDLNNIPLLEDFDNREMEICLWSDKVPDLIPSGKAALILRVGFPFDHFAHYWTGEKQRKEDYKPYKEKLASSLVKTAEHILPGLSSAIEVMEVATPLTYKDWGQRHLGSLAGWTWSAKNEESLGGKILVKTPIPNILMAGIYAASELFLGGIPTAIYTGSLAAESILLKESKN
jgi:phytoene dehydrogenase-like protein